MSLAAIDNISGAAGSMWRWVIAMEMYAKAFKDIEPKRVKVSLLKEKLKKSEDELSLLQSNYNKLKETIEDLNFKLKQA